MMQNIYDEISHFKKIAKSNFKILDLEIIRFEKMMSSIDEDEWSSIHDLYQMAKSKREELNLLYFKVNVHNPDYQSSKKDFLTKTGNLMERIFNFKNTKI